MSKPRISLCMIAKDEAPILRACLEAARPAVDEIILVDTGSSDATAQIAASCGAKVFHHPWKDDFSEARNHSLGHASGNWVLWLDADEILQPGAASAIRKAAGNPKAAGYYLQFTNILDEGKQTQYLMPRLFLRRPEIRFVNVIHEQILASIEEYARQRNLTVEVCDARVFHHGYQRSEMQRKGKVERTMRMFRKQLSLFPQDAYSWYKFGDFLRKDERDEAIRALRKSLDLIRAAASRGEHCPNFTADAAALLATEEQALGHEQEALDALETVAQLKFPVTPNFLFARACIARAQGDHAQALENFALCMRADPKSLAVGTQWGVQGPLAWYGIGESKAALGDSRGAEEALRRAVELAPQHTEIVLSLATLLLRQARALDCLECLTNYLTTNPPDSELWTKYGDPLLHLALRTVSREVTNSELSPRPQG